MSENGYSLPQSSQNSENMELVASNRRLTTAILGMTLLTGLVACLSYLAGRTVTHLRAQASAVSGPAAPPEPVVVTPQAPAMATSPPPAASTASIPSGTYLQVGFLNPAVDRSLQDRLIARGYDVKLTPMESTPNFRLLIGPIQSPSQGRELESKLIADGYQYFRRRY